MCWVPHDRESHRIRPTTALKPIGTASTRARPSSAHLSSNVFGENRPSPPLPITIRLSARVRRDRGDEREKTAACDSQVNRGHGTLLRCITPSSSGRMPPNEPLPRMKIHQECTDARKMAELNSQIDGKPADLNGSELGATSSASVCSDYKVFDLIERIKSRPDRSGDVRGRPVAAKNWRLSGGCVAGDPGKGRGCLQ